MSRSRRNYDEELWNLMTALADSALDASDDEMLSEADQESPEEIRSALLGAVNQFKRRRLEGARLEYEKAVSETQAGVTSWLPGKVNEKREYLVALLQRRPELQTALTLQFRDFSQLSEEDIDSLLRQLGALGVLDDAKESKE